MATLRLRDRDAILTKEDLIFRVFGYSHPSKAHICDVEYAPAEIFNSRNPKAFRIRGSHVYFKFYEDEGWRFVQKNYPKYMIFHGMIHRNVTGVRHHDIVKMRRPEKELKKLTMVEPKDELLAALQNFLKIMTQQSSLSEKNFGVFGSLLHGFHHPRFSDIDLVIYDRKSLARLRETLQDLYANEFSSIKNEFETDESVRGKNWKFTNFSPKEYVWHQRRKMIYALFNDERSGRKIKAEFEPVKIWQETSNRYCAETTIRQEGWTKMIARVVQDEDAPFIPSMYVVDPLEILNGTKDAAKVRQIVSYVEEFRMQACRDEIIQVEGNLEKVITAKEDFYQVTLTDCPRYYEQVLKVAAS